MWAVSAMTRMLLVRLALWPEPARLSGKGAEHGWQWHGVRQHAVSHCCNVIEIHARRVRQGKPRIGGYGDNGAIAGIQRGLVDGATVDLQFWMPLVLEPFHQDQVAGRYAAQQCRQ